MAIPTARATHEPSRKRLGLAVGIAIAETLRRYFVANPAKIIGVRRVPGCGSKFVRTRCGNADGFFLWGLHVCWRRPWSKVWGWDRANNRWVPAYSLAQGIEAQRAETGTGSVHESPVAKGDAP